MGKEYLANLPPESGDLMNTGVKGMKWGIRKKDAPAAPTKKSGPETSSDKYTRLLAQAKKGGGNSLSDDDLRFVTQRGDAIAKVNRLNEQKPGWIQDVAQQVIKQAAKKQLQSITENVSKKYIGDVLGN